jgi:hypothetical protein
LRVGPACFIDGWNDGANRNATPASFRLRSTTSGGAAIATPSASSTSALPHRLDTDRLPCFATVTPHAAMTSALAEDTLNVPARSPPVPHVSNASGYERDSFTECARMVRARPTISSGRSPFIDRPTSNAASCAEVAWPVITRSMAAAASSAVRSSCRVSFISRSVSTASTFTCRP